MFVNDEADELIFAGKVVADGVVVLFDDVLVIELTVIVCFRRFAINSHRFLRRCCANVNMGGGSALCCLFVKCLM